MADKHHVNLEDLDRREFAGADLRGFLAQYPNSAILDEIHRIPMLLSYLQSLVDNDSRKGLFILTGSQQFGLRDHLAQTLTGRVGLLELLQLSLSELSHKTKQVTLAEQLWLGGYPRIRIWHSQAAFGRESSAQTAFFVPLLQDSAHRQRWKKGPVR